MIIPYLNKLSKARVVTQKDGYQVYDFFSPFHNSGPEKRMFERWRIGGNYPSIASVALTYDCQMNCKHCSSYTLIDKARKPLSTEELKQAISDIQDMYITTMYFTGGEALLREDIYEVIASVDKERTQVILVSNGILLNEYNAQKLKEAGVGAILVSLDSGSEQEHDLGRGYDGAFLNAKKGILTSIEAGIPTGVATYISDGREEDVGDILQQAYEMGVHEVNIRDYIPTGRIPKSGGEAPKIPSQKTREAVIKLEEKFKNLSRPMSVIYQEHHECMGAKIMFTLSAYGDILFCDFNPVVAGNVRQHTIQTCWDRLTDHEYLGTECNTCRMRCKKYTSENIEGKTSFPVDIKEIKTENCHGKTNANNSPRWAVNK